MRYLLLAILWATFIFDGCGYFKKSPELGQPFSTLVQQLMVKQAKWLSDLKSQSDVGTGMPDLNDCDLAMWAGQAKAAGASWVQLGVLEQRPGYIIRNPARTCTPSSREMILGYGYGKWTEGDLGAFQRLAGYGETNQWFMSDDHALSYIDPVGQGIVGRAIDGLSGGTDKRGYERVPLACVPPLEKDYERHIQVTEALLGGEVADRLEGHRYGLWPKPLDIPQGCTEVLRELAEDSPSDALFAAAYGVYSGSMDPAFSLLLDDNYVCPSYVRGAPTYCLVHKTFAAYTVLRRVQR